jgi:hypothetical protein
LVKAWNEGTLADFNKLENIPRKSAHLCYSQFIQSDFPDNYNLILDNLNFRIVYSRQHLIALFLVAFEDLKAVVMKSSVF